MFHSLARRYPIQVLTITWSLRSRREAFLHVLASKTMDTISRPIRILHLDDNPADAALIKAMVEEATDELRASVESVFDKGTYQSALRSHAYDVILSDYRMPGYDGDEALHDAKALCPDIPFIMVTGEMGEERAIETLKAGATDYVLKDRIQRLVPSIKRALKDAALEREHRETEKLLAKMHQELDAIVDGMVEGMVVVDMQGKILRRNVQALEVLAYDYGAEFIHSLPEAADVFEIFFADGRPMPVQEWPMSRLLRGEPVKDYLTKYHRRDSGISRTLSHNGSLIRDEAGNPLFGVLTFRDVTEQVDVQEALRLSEEKFAIAFANNPAIITLTRLNDGVYLDVNDTWVETTGYHREEAIGHSARRMPIWPTEDDVVRFVQEIREKGFVRGWEQEFRKKSGERFITTLSSQVLTIHGEKVVLSTMVDITERKRTEEALKASEENMRLMVNHATEAMIVVDMSGLIEAVSPLGAHLLGYAEHEVIGKRASEFADTFSRLEVALTLEELHKRAPESMTMSSRIRTKDGEIQLINLTVRIVNPGTKAEKFFITFSRLDLPSGLMK